jgi:hypothetical protein
MESEKKNIGKGRLRKEEEEQQNRDMKGAKREFEEGEREVKKGN